MKWYKELGGLKVLEARNIEKSALLYDEIDRNRLFVGTAERADRSRMNVCFVMAPEYTELEEQFADYAKKQGMVGIKGHRSVGGFRASLYNAMPLEGVKALVQCMQEFEKTV
jgi:phosphoserine aminotransferase